MKPLLTIKNISIVFAFAALCALAASGAPDPLDFPDAGPWYSIVPPLLAVCLALLTNRLLLSLLSAVLIGGLLVSVPDSAGSLSAWTGGVGTGLGYLIATLGDSWNLQVLGFVVVVLAMVSVLVASGGMHGVANWLKGLARGSRSTQLATALMGIAVFIDDYANTMLVGSTMRPLTDRHGVSREKLAFLVDATSAPIAGLAVISTWIGYEVGLFNDAASSLGIDRNGYAIFFDVLCFRYYCVLMIVFVLINAASGRDFGPMKAAERRARDEGKPAADDARPMVSKTFASADPDPTANFRAITAVIPIMILFASLIAGLWIDGGRGVEGAFAMNAFLRPSIWRDVLANSENSALALAVAGGI
ncbi:MAG: hypothetical protein IID54_04985 [Proteobacteria bacterium]|nr:hypothetical protein [Pseudomonadota bacterium]